jgi:hypothetical protein
MVKVLKFLGVDWPKEAHLVWTRVLNSYLIEDVSECMNGFISVVRVSDGECLVSSHEQILTSRERSDRFKKAKERKAKDHFRDLEKMVKEIGP